MIALVFVILKHSLQWRGEFRLYFGPAPEFLLVNSAARRFSMAASFEKKFFIQLSLLMLSLTIFGSAGIWADNQCPASQWKCWKSNICSSVFNKYIYIHIYKFKFSWMDFKRALNSNSLEEQRWNSLSAGQTSGNIHSFNATDLFRMAKGGHTRQAV